MMGVADARIILRRALVLLLDAGWVEAKKKAELRYVDGWIVFDVLLFVASGVCDGASPEIDFITNHTCPLDDCRSVAAVLLRILEDDGRGAPIGLGELGGDALVIGAHVPVAIARTRWPGPFSLPGEARRFC